MANEQVNLDLTATDKASKVIDQVADDAADLEKNPAEIEVTADTDQAVRTLDDLTGEAKRLASQDWIVDFKADISQAKDDAAKLESQLKQTGDAGETAGKQVDSVGGSNKVNAIRDLTGPLGEVSGQVGDMGESFTAAGELIEEKMGLAAGSLTSLLGPIGLAAGAVFTFWNMWKKSAEEAKQRTEDVVKALAAGDFTKAANDLTKAYGHQISDGEKLGLSLQDITHFITGTTDSLGVYTDALEGLTDPGERARALHEKLSGVSIVEGQKIQGTITALQQARGEYDKTGDSLAATQRRQFEVTKAIGGTNDALLEQAKVAVPAVRNEILNYIAVTNGIPKEKMTAILTDLDPDDAAQVRRELDNLTKPRTVEVSTIQKVGAYAAPTYGAPRSTTNVTVNVPAGMRPDDVIAAADRYARRNGGRASRARR
jgi:hypothetical protein